MSGYERLEKDFLLKVKLVEYLGLQETFGWLWEVEHKKYQSYTWHLLKLRNIHGKLVYAYNLNKFKPMTTSPIQKDLSEELKASIESYISSERRIRLGECLL